MTLTRPDLSQRRTFSKSAYNTWDLCGTKAYFEDNERRPFVPTEKVSFGSALDAAIEIAVVGIREGHELYKQDAAILEAIEAVEVRDDLDLPKEELLLAVRGFRNEVAPKFDLTEVRTQVAIDVDIPGIGPVSGHPDLLLPNPWDVKSSSREKALPSVELGLYAIMVERAEGRIVPEAGYMTWVRPKRWVIQHMPITPEVRRWTWERAARYAAVRRLDPETQKAVAGGPKFDGLCQDCVYAPWNGGGCSIAFKGGTEA